MRKIQILYTENSFGVFDQTATSLLAVWQLTPPSVTFRRSAFSISWYLACKSILFCTNTGHHRLVIH